MTYEEILAEGLEKYGDAFSAYIFLFDAADMSIEDFEIRYVGEYESPADFAEEMTFNYDNINIPDYLFGYIDFDSYGQDMLLDDYCEHDGHYFRRY